MVLLPEVHEFRNSSIMDGGTGNILGSTSNKLPVGLNSQQHHNPVQMTKVSNSPFLNTVSD
jgi:hypothetical protein